VRNKQLRYQAYVSRAMEDLCLLERG